MRNLSIRIFENPQFGEVRVTEIDGKIYFAGIDAAKALGYADPDKALSDHCRNVAKHHIPADCGMQEISIISESDLGRLIAKSDLPGAEDFKSWILDKILPSIYGEIVSVALTVSSGAVGRQALLMAQDIISRQTQRIWILEEQIEQLKNKLQKNESWEQEQRISKTVLFTTNFREFADSYFVPKPENHTDVFSPPDKGYFNTFIRKKDSFEKFRKTLFFKQRKNYTVQKFKQHIERWCRDRGYQLNPESMITDRANGRIIKKKGEYGKSEEFFYIADSGEEYGVNE
jgi:prophage antirepressor-like protein